MTKRKIARKPRTTKQPPSKSPEQPANGAAPAPKPAHRNVDGILIPDDDLEFATLAVTADPEQNIDAPDTRYMPIGDLIVMALAGEVYESDTFEGKLLERAATDVRLIANAIETMGPGQNCESIVFVDHERAVLESLVQLSRQLLASCELAQRLRQARPTDPRFGVYEKPAAAVCGICRAAITKPASDATVQS